MDRWREIPSFPFYVVSDRGQVRNQGTGHFLAILVNQGGVAYVSITRSGQQYSRSVAKLVAEAFLPPPQHESWDTPMNLNGNRADNRVENLMWRPRWFVAKYHRQMHQADWSVLIQVEETGQEMTIAEAAMKYGALPIDLFNAAMNYTYYNRSNALAWPTRFHFKMVESTHITTRRNRRV